MSPPNWPGPEPLEPNDRTNETLEIVVPASWMRNVSTRRPFASATNSRSLVVESQW